MLFDGAQLHSIPHARSTTLPERRDVSTRAATVRSVRAAFRFLQKESGEPAGDSSASWARSTAIASPQPIWTAPEELAAQVLMSFAKREGFDAQRGVRPDPRRHRGCPRSSSCRKQARASRALAGCCASRPFKSRSRPRSLGLGPLTNAAGLVGLRSRAGTFSTRRLLETKRGYLRIVGPRRADNFHGAGGDFDLARRRRLIARVAESWRAYPALPDPEHGTPSPSQSPRQSQKSSSRVP